MKKGTFAKGRPYLCCFGPNVGPFTSLDWYKIRKEKKKVRFLRVSAIPCAVSGPILIPHDPRRFFF